MSKHFFWLTKKQFAKIRPHLPTDTCAVARVDDRRVISGIIHVLKSGGRWTKIHALADQLCRLLAFTVARGAWRRP